MDQYMIQFLNHNGAWCDSYASDYEDHAVEHMRRMADNSITKWRVVRRQTIDTEVNRMRGSRA